MMTKNMKKKADNNEEMENALKDAIELTKLKSEYACVLILQKHGLIGKKNMCIYRGLLEAAFEIDGKQYFVDCVDAIPNSVKKQTTYKYVIYKIAPSTQKQVRIANGQKTIADLF